MSSSVISNQNLGNFHIGNTIVSASTVAEALGPVNLQAREFDSLTNPNLPITLSAATGTHILTNSDLVQSAVSAAVVINGLNTSTGLLSWGPDNASNAQAIQNVFNLDPVLNPFVTTYWQQWTPASSLNGGSAPGYIGATGSNGAVFMATTGVSGSTPTTSSGTNVVIVGDPLFAVDGAANRVTPMLQPVRVELTSTVGPVVTIRVVPGTQY